MRTNNKMLRKTIAFVSSLTMLASSIPAFSIAASATASVKSSAMTEPYADTVYTANAANDKAKINTFNIFVKMDGKYLAKKSGVYKLYASVAEAETAGYKVVTLNDMALTRADNPDTTRDEASDANDTKLEADSYLVPTDATVLDIPYFADAGSTITLEFAQKKGASLSSKSETSIEINLDDNGIGKIAKQSKYVIGISDNSDYDESKEDIAGTTGSYEVVNLSGLKVRMENAGGTPSGCTFKTDGVTNTSNAVKGTVGFNALNTTEAEYEEIFPTEENITPLSYEVKKVNGVYANVVTADIAPAVAPGAKVSVDTNANANWTVSGSNIDSEGILSLTMGDNGYAQSGLVTFTKTSTGEKAYYVYVISNDKNNLKGGTSYLTSMIGVAGATNQTLATQADRIKVTSKLAVDTFADNTVALQYPDAVAPTAVGIKGADNTETIPSDNVANNTNNALQQAGTDGSANPVAAPTIAGVQATGKTKVVATGTTAGEYDGTGAVYWCFTDEEVAEIEKNIAADAAAKAKAEKSQKRYVTEYTVYNNEIASEYSSTKSNAKNQIGLIFANTVSLPDGRANNGTETVAITGNAPAQYTYNIGSSGNTFLLNKTAGADTSNAGTVVTLSKSAAGTAVSDIIKTNDGKYIRIKFTNSYELKYSDDNTLTNEEAEYDGKVSVSGVTVTRPTDPEKAGSKFTGWEIGTAEGDDFSKFAGVDLFTVVAGAEQVTEDTAKITPNSVLKAAYEGINYKVSFDAGDGYINNLNKSSATSFASYDGTRSPKTSVYNGDDIGSADDYSDVKAVEACRAGYKFLGWAMTEGAAKPMTEKEFKAAFPGEDKTLKLYAVYEALSVNVNFNEIKIDGTTGAAFTTEGKTADVVVTNDAFGGGSADVNHAVVNIKAGEKLGTLPTPVKKGYEFAGWYVRNNNAAGTTVSAAKVTADTVADEAVFDEKSDSNKLNETPDANGPAQTITLYAKFVQKEYNITYDLGDGSWNDDEYDDVDSQKPVSYKINAGNGNYIFYNGEGNPITTQNLISPAVGTGTFTKFVGWTINGGTAKYIDGAALLNGIKNLDAAADIVLKANYEKDSTASNASIVLDANKGAFYHYTAESSKKPTGAYTKNGTTLSHSTTPGASVSSVWEINSTSSQVGSAADAKGDVVARPGYTFTGWFTDKECTTPYTFSKFPAKGTETIVYAGWKANTRTMYRLNFNLINKNSSFVADTDNDGYDPSDDADFTFTTTFGGTTGETVKAAGKSFELNGKTYNFSKNDSTGLDTEATLTASFRAGHKAGLPCYPTYADVIADNANGKQVDGSDITSEDEAKACENLTWVLDPSISQINGSVKSTKLTGINTGDFVLDADKYTVIEGNFVEGYEDKELGTVSATSITVAEDGTVKWTAADNAVKYKVIKIGSNGKAYAGKETTDTTFKFASVPTSDYEVQVVAFDADGNKTTSEKVKVTVKSTGTLGTVDAKTITVGTDRKTVTWTAIEGATSYRVIKTVNGKSYASAAVTEPTYTFANVTYSAFSVKVVAMKGTEKTYSDAVNVAVAESADHGKVVNPKVSKDGKVTWEAVEGATSYRVAKFINDKAYYGTEVKAPATEYKFAKVPTDDYKVYVVSYFADGSKTYGTITKVSTKLDAPQNVKLSADKKTVTFDAVEGAVKYQIKKTTIAGKAYYGSKFTGTSVTMGSAATKGMTIQVLAFDADGNSSLSDGVVVE